MELAVKEYQKPAPIEFNYEELREELIARTQDYKTIAYTADTIKQARTDRASLNKLKKALNDERIRLEKEYMEPFFLFKTQVQELIRIIDEAASAVDRQVKDYEELQKEQKRAEITELFQTSFNDYPWLTLKAIWDEKWLNASVSMKKIQEAFDSWEQKIKTDTEMLGRLPEYSFEAIETYKQTLKVEDAMWQADHLKMMADAKKEAEANKSQPETAKFEYVQTSVEDFIPVPENANMDVTEPHRTPISFRVYVTLEEATKLAHYMRSEGIKFERI